MYEPPFLLSEKNFFPIFAQKFILDEKYTKFLHYSTY